MANMTSLNVVKNHKLVNGELKRQHWALSGYTIPILNAPQINLPPLLLALTLVMSNKTEKLESGLLAYFYTQVKYTSQAATTAHRWKERRQPSSVLCLCFIKEFSFFSLPPFARLNFDTYRRMASVRARGPSSHQREKVKQETLEN